jgi:transcriptional regulator with XRE-family HTH domain
MAGAIYSEAQKMVSAAFAKARRDAGMRQIDLAEAISKHQSYVSDIERGQRRIDVLELYVVAKALRRDPASLYADLIIGLPEEIPI